MPIKFLSRKLFIALLFFFSASFTFANEVEIVMVKMRPSSMSGSGDTWTFSVTLKHGDKGWKHYADAWRVVDENGKELGRRTLHHPHDYNIPFERSQSGIKIPAGAKFVFVEAHDKVHKWSDQRIKIDLSKSEGKRYKIIRK